MSAIAEKHSELRRTPASITQGWMNVTPTTRESIIGIREIANPVSAEASISPKRIVQTDTGQDTNLSRVLAWLSTGKTIGDIAEQVKKIDTAISPGISVSTGICRPKAKERNIKPGQSTPIRITCPLE
jgi:hypothetical protein